MLTVYERIGINLNIFLCAFASLRLNRFFVGGAFSAQGIAGH